MIGYDETYFSKFNVYTANEFLVQESNAWNSKCVLCILLMINVLVCF